ncbi:MAG: Arc family DNA-binding protein [Ignavibacteriales bacterium]|nr:Arc family DNA-binding protein [Ignavibacteriales bacterium]
MAEKKKFLLRIDENIYAALEKWAADELRSINGQIEYLLKDSLKNAGRLKSNTGESENNSDVGNSPG